MSERIWFGRSSGFYSGLTRLLQFSQWDQVGIEFDADLLYRVTRENGVERSTLKAFKNDTTSTLSVQVNIKDVDRAKAFLEKQVGKRYNYFHDFYLCPPKSMRDSVWSPADLAVYALNEGQLKATLKYDSLTPNELWVDLHLVNAGMYE